MPSMIVFFYMALLMQVSSFTFCYNCVLLRECGDKYFVKA